MASPRINVFENFNNLHNQGVAGLSGNQTLHAHVVDIPGSLSFNNVAFIVSQNHTSASLSVSFGLYSLSGGTLSLANSASGTTNLSSNRAYWMTLATSAAQDITPGNWFFAAMSSTGGQADMSFIIAAQPGNLHRGGIGGPFVRGVLSVSQTAMPVSIATSDFSKEGGGAVAGLLRQPYILISA